MATANGTSIKGLQNLVVSASAPSNLVSIIMNQKPTRPFILYGYYTLFQFENLTPFRTYLVESGRFYSPGLLLRPRVALLSSAYSWGLDMNWNVPGRTWTATIA